VFSLGADEHYIVVKQHPGKSSDDKIAGDATIEVSKVVSLSKAEFDQLSASAHLPRFTKTFADLE
jgi:hypothetical protein